MNERTFDFHRYMTSDVWEGSLLQQVVREAWEMGVSELTLIHGHGIHREIPRPFANTNTGPLGVAIRSVLRNEKELRRWIYAKIDVSDPGATTIRLKPNPQPSRSDFSRELLEDE